MNKKAAVSQLSEINMAHRNNGEMAMKEKLKNGNSWR